ncbi:DUF5060 domain-containing protein [Lactiplantibacillus pentosus]|uniref:DUF5060 domain-containing protein n=1 Tax=Lactiplantibacillus pentosus TaxID=1589 RepID=UPI001C1EBD9F|nr:DUF5060 domain-containing protein [Lactiplantibacillus pentosus]MBU7464792.1 DUF5060 domain-containing protein [Lactiplantibacillus pentosus]MBU7490830.1 DUF5060 domain-containing protein [Lactiplantibacillus pentosus]MBU7492952.1 DUF5060 domain-containing protein [Lactiplantibacillus pentosus]MBU7518927.1 DUF5060 domain-containing protein [Lactiplantibacillus pentosus]MBU7526975.1 DUF5060 domain-containing protein [Lactiplantibacillus pentosus]
MNTCERWRSYELTLEGPTIGNPFTDVDLFGEFSHGSFKIKVRGFYDGNGQYKIRYMPEMTGEWQVKTVSNVSELDDQTAQFECVPAASTNHGPVRVQGKTHFAYADGNAYMPFGTTAYAWTVQSEARQKLTLKTLSENSFNKIRMTVFPKNYNYNTTEPDIYPYEGAPKYTEDQFTFDSWQMKPEDIGFDFSRFNPKYFQHLEKRIADLDKLGIEADLILFHPYDHWGFARMGERFDKLYLQYIIARLASYKNVWWALANEYDLLALAGQKPLSAWDVIGQTVQAEDPSNHLTSIHNFYDPPQHKDTQANWYDHTKPWITHLSLQTDNLFLVPKWIHDYQKPVVVDECRYEGNIEFGWGDNTAKGMLDSFYRTVLRGGYASHGETYIDKPNTKRSIWWAHGGVLYGQSQKRINFFKKVLDEEDFKYIIPYAVEGPHWELAAGASSDERKVFVYFGDNQPEFEVFDFLPSDSQYTVRYVDTWNMTIEDADLVVNNKDMVRLARTQGQALLLTKK